MQNNRRNFIKLAGLASTASLISTSKAAIAQDNGNEISAQCVLIPSETSGPFPLDLSANTNYFRQDIRENQTGVQLNVKLKITGVDNCEPDRKSVV